MGSPLRLGFIGAGDVNFGGGEGPWDHASRFERIDGVQFVAVADRDLAKARQRVEARQQGRHGELWHEVKVFNDWRRMVDEVELDAMVVGLPPIAHGRLAGNADVEAQLAQRGVAMLVEKPLSLAPVGEVMELASMLRESKVITSVGYMFRYAQAVDRMKQVLQEHGGTRAFLARYDCAYSEIRKPAWWDVKESGGPIVEQATHFLDLARYLCGEVDLASVQVQRIAAHDAPGKLNDLPRQPDGRAIDAGLPESDRIARTTAAQWRFANGALGSLVHGVLLHGRAYHAELEAWGDGIRCVLADPYGRCRLGIRYPDSEETRWEVFQDDMYATEDQAFVEAVRQGDSSRIRCLYADAAGTYALSRTISDARFGRP